jgi:hypothetical protein
VDWRELFGIHVRGADYLYTFISLSVGLACAFAFLCWQSTRSLVSAQKLISSEEKSPCVSIPCITPLPNRSRFMHSMMCAGMYSIGDLTKWRLKTENLSLKETVIAFETLGRPHSTWCWIRHIPSCWNCSNGSVDRTLLVSLNDVVWKALKIAGHTDINDQDQGDHVVYIKSVLEIQNPVNATWTSSQYSQQTHIGPQHRKFQLRLRTE